MQESDNRYGYDRVRAGTYTVTVTDQYGCSDDTTVTVLEPDVLVANTTGTG